MTHDYLFNRIIDEFQSDQIPGWCPIEKALELAACVVALRPKTVLEIGVFGGKSLLPMALACEAVGHGFVIGIDPWSPAASAEGYSGENRQWWSNLDHEQIYRGFVTNTKRLGLENRVAVERAKSDDAWCPVIVDILHADGQHTEQAIRDVRKFAPHVRMGGLVILDDLEWVNAGVPHVAQAVEVLLGLGFMELHRTKQANGCWGVFQRIYPPALAPTGGLSPQQPGARGRVVKRKGRKGKR